MSSSLSLVLQHIGTSQQVSIVDDIVQHLKTDNTFKNHEPYIDTMCELVNQIPDPDDKYANAALGYCIKILELEDTTEYFELILKLSLKIDTLAKNLMQYVVKKLKIYALTNPRHFNEKLSKKVGIVADETQDYELSSEFILNLLKFVEWYFLHFEAFSTEFSNSLFDNLCYIYLTNEVLDIAKVASRILRWRMPLICSSEDSTSFMWSVIFELEESEDSTEKSFGYTLWLRFFNYFKPATLMNDSHFQKILSDNRYWFFLRDGLISLTHEHKKFALTLLQVSIQSLNTNLDSPIIKWDCSKREEYTESWMRFCTLYEILGIDAAMNQIQAASNDLLRIFAADSAIPVPFSLTILSVGFKASMDKMKKFALNLTFNLPKESLSLFKYDFKFISHVFLPFAMKSPNFSVEKTKEGKFTCQFGNQVRQFICDCVDSLETVDDITNLVTEIFDVISNNRLTFGIARIYIIWGVLNGLEKKAFQPLNAAGLRGLLPLFETTAEGEICLTTLQTIHLKLLLQVNPQAVTAGTFVSALVVFIQNNGYKIYAQNEDFFFDYFNAYFDREEMSQLVTKKGGSLSVEGAIVLLSYLLSIKTDVSTLAPSIISHPKCYELLVQMAHCGLGFKEIWTENLIVSKVECLVNEMVIGSEALDISVYSDSTELLSNVLLFSNEFWDSMRITPLFEAIANKLIAVNNMQEAHYYIAQFKFVTLCFDNCIYNEDFGISLQSIMNLMSKALKKVPKGSDSFYKAKDQLIAYITDNIRFLFKITPFESTFRSTIMEIADEVAITSAYYGHLSNLKLLKCFLENIPEKESLSESEVSALSSIVDTIWEDIIKDRLILSQRDLHQEFIKFSLHRKLLIASINNTQLANTLFQILDHAITQSAGRKAIMPCLVKAISIYQVQQPVMFEETLWLAKLIVKATFLFQSEVNIFQLDCLVADEFDKILNVSGNSLYHVAYGDPEISYRATLFGVVGAIKTPLFATQIWSYIFDNESMFLFLTPKKRTDREEQWKRIQFLSLFVTTVELVTKDDLLHYTKTYLLPRIFKEASPLCRTYMEWIICICILRVPSFRKDVFAALDEGMEAQQPLVVVTFERISMLTAMQLPADEEAKFLSEFVVNIVIPLSSSNRALNRHYSTSMACVVYDEIKRKNLEFDLALKETLKKIDQTFKSVEQTGTYRNGDALLWDVKKDLNLVSITGGVLLKVSDREIDGIFEEDYNKYLDAKQKAILRVPIGANEKDKWVPIKERRNEVKVETYYVGHESEESSLLQTKSGAWSTVMELDEDSRAAAQVKRSPLIVVSSLVDKAPNLGGICRLCDCLGAGWMTVHDMAVKDDHEFKSVAVTADRWMPLIEVKMDDIIEFMRLKKKEGYTLIGLEQTDKSVELNGDLKFPEKSLILIGKEKEGIPGDLLAELDMCVIIKQVGIVRSMNIQTATAVIVHAYSSQHC